MRSIDTSGLNWRTLATEIRSQGNTLLEPHGISFSLDASIEDQTEAEPGSLLCVNLFKIYRESLTNIIKHARATAVAAGLTVSRDRLTLSISDNGIGCSQHDCSGRGLANIRRRAAELGGTVELSSDAGTKLVLAVPFPLNTQLAGLIER